MAFGGLCFGTGFDSNELSSDVKKVDDVSAEKSQKEKVDEEEYIELFVVVKELDEVHDYLWRGHELRVERNMKDKL